MAAPRLIAAELAGWLEDLRCAVVDQQPETVRRLGQIRRDVSRLHRLKAPPGDAQLFTMLDDEMRIRLGPLLRRKPTRTLSGVAPVAIMSSPFGCPHGTCTYCPGGPEFGTAQSYTGHEPAARRAARHGFESASQVLDRLGQFEAIGHDTSKVDLIVMGGTFTARSEGYRDEFIKGAFDAANSEVSVDLDSAMLANETASHRIIGLTLETRPDQCSKEQIDWMLDAGATRVELGIQSLDDEVLRSVHRGHSVAAGQRAAKRLRDAGLKINLHMMPGLPDTPVEKDFSMLHEVMKGEDWRPDMLKIYPCLVVKGAQLVEQWTSGEFIALDDETAIDLIADVMHDAPPWLRIQRIQRDIPAHEILAGVRAGNLRQLASRRLVEQGRRSGCIRDREIGRVDDPPAVEEFELITRAFRAAGGDELFLSFEAPFPIGTEADRDGFDRGMPVTNGEIHEWSPEDPPGGVLAGFLRMRRPSEDVWREELGEDVAIVREVKIFGRAVGLGENSEQASQHRGLGTRLMHRAEQHAAELWGVERIFVTAGVGVRQWYVSLGYSRCGPWMAKRL